MHGIFIMSSVYFILFIFSSQNTSVNLQVLFLTCLSSHSINLILWRDVVKKGEINKESKLSSGFPWSAPLWERSGVGESGGRKSQYFTHLGLTEFDRLQKETWRDGYRWWKTHFVSSAVNHTQTESEAFFFLIIAWLPTWHHLLVRVLTSG